VLTCCWAVAGGRCQTGAARLLAWAAKLLLDFSEAATTLLLDCWGAAQRAKLLDCSNLPQDCWSILIKLLQNSCWPAARLLLG
jgi:hypothetical protein